MRVYGISEFLNDFNRYFITYIMDTTVGVALCFIMISIFERIFEARGNEVLSSPSFRNSKLAIITKSFTLILRPLQSVVKTQIRSKKASLKSSSIIQLTSCSYYFGCLLFAW